MRTGLDNCVGYLKGGYQTWVAQYPDQVETITSVTITNPEDYETYLSGKQLLDVRGLDAWEGGIVDAEPQTKL